MRHSNPDPKNVASRNSMVIRRKKVAKELDELLRSEGHGVLFPMSASAGDKQQARLALRKERIVGQALEFGMQVPQKLVDEVFPPTEPNPCVTIKDDGKAPF